MIKFVTTTLLTFSFLTPHLHARSILKTKTPILIYKSKTRRDDTQIFSSDIYERISVAKSATLSSDRYGITLMNRQDTKSKIQFEYLIESKGDSGLFNLEYHLSCIGACLVKTRVRCESNNQDKPKITRIASLSMLNEDKVLHSKKLRLDERSCSKGLYFIETYTIDGISSRLQIKSVKPRFHRTFARKATETKKL